MTFLKTALILALAVSIDTWAAGVPASITGNVLDDSGNPVQGAVVSFQQVPELTRGQLGGAATGAIGYSTTAQSGSNGSFSVSGLPSGQYYLCAYPNTPGYLSNCEWTTVAPSIGVREGASLAAAPLVMRKGTVVQIVADDPAGVVQTTSGMVAVPGPHHFFPSVRTAAGYFSSARQTGQTGNQHTFTLTIPKTVTVELRHRSVGHRFRGDAPRRWRAVRGYGCRRTRYCDRWSGGQLSWRNCGR